MEEANMNPDALSSHQSLERRAREFSEKLDDERLEEESIASALEGDREDEQDPATDLEKATTQASRTSHEPVQRVRTAVDWDGPDDPGK